MDSNHRLTDFKSVDSSAGLYPHKKNTHNLLETVAPVKGKNLEFHISSFIMYTILYVSHFYRRNIIF